jgi:RNA polymerase sigma-70 factor (ECF subfamily)
MLGSPQDAEDLVQETFARAWRRLETYQGRASFRAWLYKIATNACLDYLERRPRRSLPQHKNAPIDGSGPLPPPVGEPIWIEPFPEELLAPSEANPEARYEAHESISLAFLVALQVLPPRQRCVLILGDVLDWTAAEIADMLGVTISAVNSLLHHARTTLKQRYTTRKREEPRSTEADQKTKSLLERYLKAWESADIDEIVSLLTEDASFPMPPLPAWFQGHTAIRALISGTILAGEAQGRWRLLPVKANGQPAFAFYQYNPSTQTYQAFAIQVLRIEANLVDEAVTFGYPALFPFFNLPVELDRVGAKEV